MGLDMNLYKRTHIGGYGGKKGTLIFRDENGDEAEIEQGKYGITLEKDVAYWRKANQIHNWFVEHNGDGIDECQNIYVEIEDLKELLNLCEEVKRKIKKGRGLIAGGTTSNSRKNHKIFLVKPDSDNIAEITKFEVIGESESDKLKVGDWYIDTEDNSPAFTSGETNYGVKTSNGWTQLYTFGETIKNADEIAELLPTQEGFFFGSTDFDEYYLDDINNTIEILNNVIEDYNESVASGINKYDIDYVYRASW